MAVAAGMSATRITSGLVAREGRAAINRRHRLGKGKGMHGAAQTRNDRRQGKQDPRRPRDHMSCSPLRLELNKCSLHVHDKVFRYNIASTDKNDTMSQPVPMEERLGREAIRM